ncbi:MAG: TadE family type IV pilus minor pilin [Microbacteriaceae bacterium]
MRSTTAADRPAGGGDRGAATAEFAAALPAVVLVVAGCLTGLQFVGEQVRLQDAAAGAARAVARGEDEASAAARAARLVPGATVRFGVEGELECASVSLRTRAAGALLRLTLAARSCALGGGL